MGEMVKKVALAITKLIVFVLFIILSGVDIIMREILASMRSFLFPNRK